MYPGGGFELGSRATASSAARRVVQIGATGSSLFYTSAPSKLVRVLDGGSIGTHNVGDGRDLQIQVAPVQPKQVLLIPFGLNEHQHEELIILMVERKLGRVGLDMHVVVLHRLPNPF
ncbi:unnamed protein product [Cylindrotheca closterium]|uniref:Uncharacterized protein n=1 Tax=Cylindrotheca closterium TaxID=2856 RepID=A0AAD2CCI6_9STRA|nr:unnamed protein product [Cylindrotheca closterium]